MHSILEMSGSPPVDAVRLSLPISQRASGLSRSVYRRLTTLPTSNEDFTVMGSRLTKYGVWAELGDG